jgi:hypothetical protein
MHLRRRVARRLAIMAAAATCFTGIGAGAAMAADSASSTTCPAGYACTWLNSGYSSSSQSGGKYQYMKFFHYVTDYAAFKYEGTTTTASKNASSAANHANYANYAYFYKGTNGDGTKLSLKTGYALSSLLSVGFDNTFRSGRFDTEMTSWG